jgi:hypothetical protein
VHDKARQSTFREARWQRFEAALSRWLESPAGRFAVYWAARERAERDRPLVRPASAREQERGA